MQTMSLLSQFRSFTRNGLGAPLLILLMLAMIVLPLPPFILDLLFSFNISFALIVLLASIYHRKPLEFAVFPTVLLVATLLRLALNIASTRVVLLNGHTGTDAAGQVVQSFGNFVIGGNYAVGLVVFAILVIINFVVVTKGAGRVSEVSARFTLDAMPGKQMAIDADLNAGLIAPEEARKRRDEIASEADFYGSMDGSSKFVRGDAVAGILILFINIIGGLTIGILQHDMTFSQAMQNFALLTIGDGLVAQVPALLLSTAAAIMVTRVSSDQDMSSDFVGQVFGNPRALMITAAVMGIIGIIPGMPHVAFLGFAAVTGFLAHRLNESQKRELMMQLAIQQEEEAEPPPPPTKKELGWEDVEMVDTLGLEIGYRLIPLVDENQNGELMGRIRGVRKKLSQELGFLVPSVHIRDNLDLAPIAYRITLLGVPIGEAEIHVDREMAINPGQVFGELEGFPGKDPAFGLDALWIDKRFKDKAQSLGYTVVDASTVIATHLSQVMQKHASELLGHEEVQKMLDRLAKTAPKLVETLVPDGLPLGIIVRVLQYLLEENVPVRDFRTIAETLAEASARTQDPDALLVHVRTALGRLIVQNINGMEAELPVITLEPELEQLLLQTIQAAGEGGGFEPGLADRVQRSLAGITERQEMEGQPAVLLVAGPLRSLLARFTRHSIPNLNVLTYSEIPDNRHIKIIGTVGGT